MSPRPRQGQVYGRFSRSLISVWIALLVARTDLLAFVATSREIPDRDLENRRLSLDEVRSDLVITFKPDRREMEATKKDVSG